MARNIQSVVRFSPRNRETPQPRNPDNKELLPMPATLETTHQFDAARAAGREPFKVRDLSLATLGRSEIRLAEHEMPGLMTLREKFAASKPLEGARVMG